MLNCWVWPDTTCTSLTSVAKPRAATVTLYLPGGRLAISNLPAPSAFAVCAAPLPPLAVTLAFPITAPDGSVTCPRKVPVGACAEEKDDSNNTVTIKSDKHLR